MRRDTERLSLWGIILFSPFALRPANAAEGSKEPIAKKIGAIVAQAGDLSDTDENLWVNKSLKEMVAHPEKYQRDIEGYFSSTSDLPEGHVQVAVLSLQCLPLPQYLSFLDKVSSLPKGKTGERALFYAIIPGEEWSVRLQLEYKDPKVRDALGKAGQSPNATDKLRSPIKGILDGSYARRIKSSKDAPVLKCVKGDAKGFSL